MNGRIYDPTLGRFLQADPIIQAPNDSQSYNRYAYVRNNPLSLTDPSGYSWLSKAWKKIKPFIGVIVAVVGSIVCPACSPYLIGAIAGAAGAAANGGNIIQGALIGAFTAGAGQYGHIASAFAGGIASKVQGGKFGHGFLAAGLGSKIGGGSGKGLAKVISAAVVGGTISKLTGGKFSNGAYSAAFAAAISTDWGRKPHNKRRIPNSDYNDQEGVPQEIRDNIRGLINKKDYQGAAEAAADYLNVDLSKAEKFSIHMNIVDATARVTPEGYFQLFKPAFYSVSNLISTIGHEYIHVMQYNENRISFREYQPLYHANEIEAYYWEINNAHITGISKGALEYVNTHIRTSNDAYLSKFR